MKHGSTWRTAAGATGSDWYVGGLSTNSECKSAANWAVVLSKKVVATSGPVVQVYRSGSYGCVVSRPQLEATCYLGNGGAGAVGVLVAGDPVHNPLIPASIRANLHSGGGSLPPPVRQEDNAGVPEPWQWDTHYNQPTCGAGTSDTRYSGGPTWTMKLSDGSRVRGTDWQVQAFRFFSDGTCSTIRPLIPMLVGAHPSSNASGIWSWHDWTCLTTTRPAAGDIVPMSGCVRVVFPHGTSLGVGSPSLAPALEQVIEFPDVRNATTPAAHYGIVSAADQGTLLRPTTAQSNLFLSQLRQVEQTVRDYGVGLLVANWVTMTDLNFHDVNPSRRSITTDPVSTACGGAVDNRWRGSAVPSARWSSGGAHGTSWTLVSAGGYPCGLADPLFRVFLANLAASPDTPQLVSSSRRYSTPLQRYGWICDPDQPHLVVVCRFAPFSWGSFETALGHPAPRTFRVAISASGVPGLAADRAKTAIDATS